MNPLVLRLLPYLLGVGFLALLAWYWHHHGYLAGQAERTAHYEPILAAIDREKAAAEARVKATEKAAARLSKDTEDRHAQTETALQARAGAAEQRITGLVRELSAARHRDEMPRPAGPAAEPSGASEEFARLGRIGSRFTGTGQGCESDAARILEFQQFYGQQQALLGH